MECNNCAACDHRCRCVIEPYDEEKNAPRNGGVPLNMASRGDSGTVGRLAGDKDMRSYLTSLGFNPGSIITIVRKQGEDLIVDVKGSRIAMGPSIARRIYFLPGVLE